MYFGHTSGYIIRVGDFWGNTGVAFPDDQMWHHYTVVSTSSNTHLYIDGVLMASKGSSIPSPNEFAFGQSWDAHFNIGMQWGCCSEFFDGNIDELQVWNRALCEDEINHNFVC